MGRVTLRLKDVGLDDLLTRILQGSGYTYELVNGVIAIVKTKDVPRREVEQERLKGRVLDASGNALPGVTVLIKGTNMGVVTDTAGAFHACCSEGEGDRAGIFVCRDGKTGD